MAPPRQEAWLRGPISDIAPLLQPVAHSFTQALEDLPPALAELSQDELWARAGSSASIGFHVAHLTGSLDRLLTYARGEPLTAQQRAVLDAERRCEEVRPSLAELLRALQSTFERALAQLQKTREDQLLEVRHVGRAQIPSTVVGLLFHAAEHTARHVGQILTLRRIGVRP